MNQSVLHNRMLLLMKYNSSNTLSENKKIILEQEKDYSNFTKPISGQQNYRSSMEKFKEENKDQYQDLKHDINMFSSIVLAFVPIVGPFISAGISLYDAHLYNKEGDEKTAGMMAMFAMLPLVGSAVKFIGPAVTKLGQKGMAELGKKVALNQSLTVAEKEIVKNIGKNADVLKQELDVLVKTTANKTANTVTNPSIKQSLFNIGKKGLVFGAKNVAPYAAAGYAYDKTYDYLNPQQNFADAMQTSISNINHNNKRAALEIKF